ncbi:hypothetical protein [Agreia bicolorata]|uniref:hypothetical protein n=1 Tax=Agreia bicolorata TaxID=110935 RepID=UPI001115EEA9|nr:hypothetical protein [Agreia bicolorata]
MNVIVCGTMVIFLTGCGIFLQQYFFFFPAAIGLVVEIGFIRILREARADPTPSTQDVDEGRRLDHD